MELHIGTKAVNAKPMTHGEFHKLYGNPGCESKQEGYLVEYLDSPSTQFKGFNNHISWSPKDVFERAYFPSGNLSFSLALEAMKMGFIVINPYQEKRGLKGVLFGKEETPYELLMNGNERFWLPDLYALRCKEWKIVGLANREI